MSQPLPHLHRSSTVRPLASHLIAPWLGSLLAFCQEANALSSKLSETQIASYFEFCGSRLSLSAALMQMLMM